MLYFSEACGGLVGGGAECFGGLFEGEDVFVGLGDGGVALFEGLLQLL